MEEEKEEDIMEEEESGRKRETKGVARSRRATIATFLGEKGTRPYTIRLPLLSSPAQNHYYYYYHYYCYHPLLVPGKFLVEVHQMRIPFDVVLHPFGITISKALRMTTVGVP